MSMEWLMARAPGFAHLSVCERSAITDFTFIWSLFEATILDTRGCARRICGKVDSWQNDGTLRAECYDAELAYFRHRYFADGSFTDHFDHLRLPANDQEALVRRVINGSSNDPGDRVTAILLIVLRYRNNLFHGSKWQYELKGQLCNFTHANAILTKVLDQHGGF